MFARQLVGEQTRGHAVVRRSTGTSATLGFLPRIPRKQLLHGVARRSAPEQHRTHRPRDRHVDFLFRGERFDRAGGVHALRDMAELLEDRGERLAPG